MTLVMTESWADAKRYRACVRSVVFTAYRAYRLQGESATFIRRPEFASAVQQIATCFIFEEDLLNEEQQFREEPSVVYPCRCS